MEMEQNSYQGIPGLTPPSKKDHQPYIDLITKAIDWTHNQKNAPPYIIDPEASLIIYIAFLTSETGGWIPRFKDSLQVAQDFFIDQTIYFRTIAMGVSNPKVLEICKKLNPSLNPENYLIKTNPTPAPQKITPGVTHTPSTPLKKTPTLRRSPLWPRVRPFIFERQPYPSVIKVYDEVVQHLRNKKSAWGSKVYPYGQAYIARRTGLSLVQVTRNWQWLRKQGIFNKRRNENPEHNPPLCAEWFVCTSMKQVVYFQDRKNQHPKP